MYAQGTAEIKLADIFQQLGYATGVILEIGAHDGKSMSNTRVFYEQGWDCRYIEGDAALFPYLLKNVPADKCLQGFVSVEPGCTLDDLMDKLRMPAEFVCLSLDIDGNDYWVWQSLTRHMPLVVCVEYNSNADLTATLSVPYDKNFVWHGGAYVGATASALVNLGTSKGYTLVAHDDYTNLIFVLERVRPPTMLPMAVTAVIARSTPELQAELARTMTHVCSKCNGGIVRDCAGKLVSKGCVCAH
jgi:hypothetical protein